MVTSKTPIAISALGSATLIAVGVTSGVVDGNWAVAFMLLSVAAGGVFTIAYLLQPGDRTRSNLPQGVLMLSMGVGLIGLGIISGRTVAYLLSIVGVIECAAGAFYVRKHLKAW
jgi:hypothetical protein